MNSRAAVRCRRELMILISTRADLPGHSIPYGILGSKLRAGRSWIWRPLARHRYDLGMNQQNAMTQATVNVECAALSHPGKVRQNNEDHYFVARFERAMRTLLTNLEPGQVPDFHSEAAYAMLVA